MTDFLDRLAARALGGGSLLEPRLPSLFEPVVSAPVVAPTLEMHGGTGRQPPPTVAMAPTRKRETGAIASAVPVAAASSFAPAANALQRSQIDATAAQPTAGSNDSVPRVTASVLPRPPSHTRHQDLRLAEDDVPPHDVRAPPTPPPRFSAERSRGTLLPPAAPVFVSSPGANRAPASARAAGRARMAAAVDPQHRAGEPVIHVSIGRLEVRAAPAAALPSQRRAEARPSSLDDYLRQRGKAPS